MYMCMYMYIYIYIYIYACFKPVSLILANIMSLRFLLAGAEVTDPREI